MKILIIDNQIVANNIADKREDIMAYDGDLCQSMETVAEDIKNRFAERADIYIIGCHAQIGNSNLSDNSGIKLLKFLRLHHIDNHVVLYSWMSREMLMDNLQNAIVFSKGVSFFRLPYFSKFITNIDFDKLSNEKADKNELMQLFRAEYDPDNRHFDANKLGVWQLMRVQDAYNNNIEYRAPQAEDDNLRKEINDFLNSYYGKLVQYVNRQDAENLDDYLRTSTNEENERLRLKKLEEANSALDSIKRELEIVKSQICTAEKLNHPDSSGKYQGLSHHKQKEVKEILKQLAEREIEELSGRKEELENSKQYYSKIKNWAEQHIEQPVDNLTYSDFEDFSILNIRKSLYRKNPHVIYVDDMAEKGWASILKRIIYKDVANYNCLTSIVPAPTDSVETIVENICQVHNPDLIILDLRLKDEHGYCASADLSGFQVLQELGKRNLPCAILIFTASNKIWSLKEASKGNVMSYWIKGGLEQLDDKNVCINNYFNLIEQIHNLTQIKFVFEHLSSLKQMAEEINDSTYSFWWETQENEFSCTFTNNNNEEITENCKRVLSERRDVINNINMTIESIQNNLRQLYFQTGDVSLPDIFNIMVIQLAYIVEEILKDDSIDHHLCTLSYKFAVCTPGFRKYRITKTRNLAAHSRNPCLKPYDIKYKIKNYINAIREFLFYNHPDTNLNDEEEPTEIGTDRIEETQINDRLGMLNNGLSITAIVRTNTPEFRNGCITGWFYDFYIKKDSKKIEKKAWLTINNSSINNDSIKKGDYIEIRKTDTTTNEEFIITSHHKATADNNVES